jgi:hypothetical protein
MLDIFLARGSRLRGSAMAAGASGNPDRPPEEQPVWVSSYSYRFRFLIKKIINNHKLQGELVGF